MNHTKKQKNPQKNNYICIQDLVIEDIKERKKDGIKKYNTILQPFNQRNSLIDMYQEHLDELLYLKQHLIEKEKMISLLKKSKQYLQQTGIWNFNSDLLNLLSEIENFFISIGESK